ncbi:MAG TPA: permease [Actinomycetota bacterium]|nr:permease [Actinomycetota bacterium]
MAVAEAPARPTSNRTVLVVLLVGIAAVLAVRLTSAGDAAVTQTFTLIFTAIVVEALPFVLLGALVSAVIEVFVPDAAFQRLGRLPVGLQLPIAALGGFAFPVCECGSVPVARRLIRRGLDPSAGVAFMLASPIFNPIVLASTWVAYSSRGLAWQMVLGRGLVGLVLAIAAGWAIGTDGAQALLRKRADDEEVTHDHGSKLGAFAEHLGGDFLFMGKFLVIGAALAAAIQTVLPQSFIAGVARTPVIGSLGLMAVAYVASLCSEADAFVAVSFTQFPIGSQLAFLVFGPVLDFKLTFLYSAAFRNRFVIRLVAVAIPVTLAGSLVFEALLR